MTEIVGILLAAGFSKRFGTPKLLHSLPDGVTVGVAAARALLQAAPDSIAVVQAGDYALFDALTKTGMKVVENSRPDEGMGTSLAAGVNAALEADGWLITLADMPWVQPETIVAIVERLKNGASIVAPVFSGQRGHPVGFSARWREPLRELTGERGARSLIEKHAGQMELLATKDAGVLRDIDYPQDLNFTNTPVGTVFE